MLSYLEHFPTYLFTTTKVRHQEAEWITVLAVWGFFPRHCFFFKINKSCNYI